MVIDRLNSCAQPLWTDKLSDRRRGAHEDFRSSIAAAFIAGTCWTLSRTPVGGNRLDARPN